jgi:4-hydroxybenzoate polyprenyltransferase
MSLIKKLWNGFVTLYLFNKSDMKTIVAPIVSILGLNAEYRTYHLETQTVFSLALATTHSISKFCYVVLWLWTLLLQVTVSNQSIGNSPEEDAINKPNRPIPSKRISLEAARLFRWLLIPIDLAVSILLGAFPAGVCVSFMVAAYSEGRGHSHWFTKNLCCAFFYAAFEYGGTTVAGA